jgi:translation initiation factor 2B subunit (eIF-2B alpha/beta/delta family)
MAAAPMQAQIDHDLAQLQTDHDHGASWIAQRAAEILLRICQGAAQAPEQARELLRATCGRVARLRASMAPLAHVACRAWRAATDAGNDDAAALHAAQVALENLLRDAQTAPEPIAAHLENQIGLAARIVTLSQSATVTGALVAARDHIATITVLESRPGGEGVAAARELAAHLGALGWPDAVRLVADAAMALAMQDATCAIAGADALLAAGAAVNKTGTHPLALVADALHIPCFILAEEIKIAPASWRWHPEAFDPALIAPDAIPGVAVEAIVFEQIPLALVQVIAPSGTLTLPQIRQIAQGIDAPDLLLDRP